MSEFNLRGIISLWNNDTKSRLSINSWLGRTYFTVFFDGNSKPYSITINEHALFLIESYIKKALKSKEPNTKRAILLSEYDQIEKKFSHSSTITIGRNDKSFIFIELINSSFTSSDNKVTFVFLMPQSISIDDPDLANFDDIYRSEIGAGAFLSSLKDLAISKIMSRDKIDMEKSLEDFRKKKEMTNSNGSSNDSGKKSDGDIPF